MSVQLDLKQLNGHAFAGREEHYVNVLITVISHTFEKMSNAIHYVLLDRSQRSRRGTREQEARRVHAHVSVEAHATRTVSIVVAAMSCGPERPVAHTHTHTRRSGYLHRMLAEPRKCSSPRRIGV